MWFWFSLIVGLFCLLAAFQERADRMRHIGFLLAAITFLILAGLLNLTRS